MGLVLALALAILIATDGQDARPQPRDPVRKPPTSAAASSVSGRVTDAETGRPLADASVTALSTAAADDGKLRTFNAFTDASGRYTLDGLPPGEYHLTAWPGDYRWTHRPVAFGGYSLGPAARDSSPLVSLAARERRSGIDFALPRSFGIEGHVVGELGEPLEGIQVRAERLDGPGGSTRAARSDDRGAYRVFGLAPGVYRVCGQPPMVPTEVRVVGGSEGRYAPSCTPATADRSMPGAIVIQRADAVGAMLVMRGGGLFSLSGQVLNASGAPAPDVTLTISRLEGGGSATGTSRRVADGRFESGNLPPGNYQVRAELLARPGRPHELGVATVRIDGADVSGVVVQMSRGIALSGSVGLEGGTLAPVELARLRVSTAHFSSARSLVDRTAFAPVQPDLTFRLPPVFEPVAIVVEGLPRGWAVQSITFAGREIIDRETSFTASDDPQALRIVLTNRTATLTVRLPDAPGHPRRLVALMPAAPERRRAGIRLAGRPLGNGLVQFDSLAAGDYLLASWLDDGPSPIVDGIVEVERFGEVTVPVVLAAGDDRIVELRPSAREA